MAVTRGLRYMLSRTRDRARGEGDGRCLHRTRWTILHSPHVSSKPSLPPLDKKPEDADEVEVVAIVAEGTEDDEVAEISGHAEVDDPMTAGPDRMIDDPHFRTAHDPIHSLRDR